ncbi:MAG: carboxylesterase family protein [Solobacterium sp.]|nr:carboxylesterase family protein [Solobacterium sp.]
MPDVQLTVLKWSRNHISDSGGNPGNVTLAGQSAGAIPIRYLCLNHDNEGLFQRILMMSGAGLFPKSALPDYSRLNASSLTMQYSLSFFPDTCSCFCSFGFYI